MEERDPKKRIVKALKAMKHQKRMKKGFSLAMSEADHKATLWVRDLSQVIVMWYKDNPGQQDKRTTDNKGFTARKTFTALRQSVQMMGTLHLDLFCQDKYLLNHVNLKIKLRRRREAIALVADAANYSIKIKKMDLYGRKVQRR